MTHSLFSSIPIKKIKIKFSGKIFLICTLASSLFVLSGCALLSGGGMDGNHGIFDDDLTTYNSAPDHGRQEQPWNTEKSQSLSNEDEGSSLEDRIQHAVSRRDIVLGMGQSEVTAAWGHPRDIETAGVRESGNERWIYYVGNSRTYGLSNPRIVYFEQGRVVGWESANR